MFCYFNDLSDDCIKIIVCQLGSKDQPFGKIESNQILIGCLASNRKSLRIIE